MATAARGATLVALAVSDTQLQTTRLASGLTVVTERVPGARSVAYGAWVGVGSRDEEPRLAGASHFLEHLLFKGTATRTTADIAEAIDSMGGDMNAFTAREHTGFHVKCLDDDGPEALAILSDIMSAPLIASADVEVERGVIVEEILERDDEPADWVHDLVLEATFPEHPLGRDVLGTQETIEAMPRDEIAAFFAANYSPRNVVLAAAGAIDHDAVCAAGEAISQARHGSTAAPTRQAPPRPRAAVALDPQETEQVHLCIAMPTVAHDHDDRYGLAVIDQLLGGGLSSRLFQEVREKRGLAYTIYTYRSLFSDAGAFVICAGTAPTKLGDTLGVIGDELARIANDGVTARELDIAKRHLVGAFHLGLEDTGARMGSLASSQLFLGRVDDVDTAAQRIRDVAPDDVARVVRDLIAAPRVVAVVGPGSEAEISDRIANW
ncbi:MAG TPA: pitrilysin family protein [Acidimicrobiales bacterium]|nr:pitrilysin family protein [Acidimicrobiales bacterium]